MHWSFAVMLLVVLIAPLAAMGQAPTAVPPAANDVGAYQFWATVIGQVGIGGILAWFLYHQTSVAGPAKDKEHREAMKEIATQNNDTIRHVVGEIREDRERDRQARREDIAAIVGRFECRAK